MKFKGIKVAVITPVRKAGGKTTYIQLPEYAERSDEKVQYKQSAHIPAQVGRQFCIVAENDIVNDITVEFYVDGKIASNLICHPKPCHSTVTCEGVQPEAGTLRRFVFNKSTLT